MVSSIWFHLILWETLSLPKLTILRVILVKNFEKEIVWTKEVGIFQSLRYHSLESLIFTYKKQDILASIWKFINIFPKNSRLFGPKLPYLTVPLPTYLPTYLSTDQPSFFFFGIESPRHNSACSHPLRCNAPPKSQIGWSGGGVGGGLHGMDYWCPGLFSRATNR